jgi:hypothetical protein
LSEYFGDLDFNMVSQALSGNASSLWKNRKCLFFCCLVAVANTQYGIDTAAVGGLMAMPGFLNVFGYKDPTSPLGYGIDVSCHFVVNASSIEKWLWVADISVELSAAAHDLPHEPRSHFGCDMRRTVCYIP